MAFTKWWYGLSLLAAIVSAITSQDCPKDWKEHGSSCYLFAAPIQEFRLLTWEDSRANCLSYGADLVSILSSSELNFIKHNTKPNSYPWVGLYRNASTKDANKGWVWSDGNKFTNLQYWQAGQPRTYSRPEFSCAEIDLNQAKLSVGDCDAISPWICKRKKGLPDRTIPTVGTLPPTQEPQLKCDHGWIPYNRSCYGFFSVPSTWYDAKLACRDTGGHLITIETATEQYFLTHSVRLRREIFWIGLNDLFNGTWSWEFLSEDPVVYTNWESGQPNKLGQQHCVAMYGYVKAGRWNDASCSSLKSYICEKEEGRNVCPEGWMPYGDNCYQFNMRSSQKMTWTDAQAACSAIGNFSSLAKITSKSEHDFITRRLQSYFNMKDVWIGLNDITNEKVFQWAGDNTGLTKTKYQLWANRKPSENSDSFDCVKILGTRRDGAWSVQHCSLKENFICMRHRDLPFCNFPLGMSNGNILDVQITASSSLSGKNGPTQARLGRGSYWCPAKPTKNQYLQVEFSHLVDIRKIITEGDVAAYAVKFSQDGVTFMDNKLTNEGKPQLLIPVWKDGHVDLGNIHELLIARFIRIYPRQWKNYPCLRVEFIGCSAKGITSTECSGYNWEKGPGNLCFQINQEFRTWEDARSVCMDRGDDLATIRNEEERNAISRAIKKKRSSYLYSPFWISLNDRDYRGFYYWSNDDPNTGFMSGSGSPRELATQGFRECAAIWYEQWRRRKCSDRNMFICMKRLSAVPKNVVKTGPSGIWISSAKYYWPLSAIANKTILGTRLGKVYGKVTPTTGVREKRNSALKFASAGSYIDLGIFENECLTSPNTCSSGLTLQFMASFDQDAASWSKRVNILDSANDETKNQGISIYVQNKRLWFVVSITSKYVKSQVRIVGDNIWRHYVMRWDKYDVTITVDGQRAGNSTTTKTDVTKNNPAKNVIIGLRKDTGIITSGEMNLAMVAYWDTIISDDDITSIYKAEFGKCPLAWIEYGMSCYQLNPEEKDFDLATNNCQSQGGDIIEIDSNVEQAFITNHITLASWIGINRKTREVLFKNTNPARFRYSNWHSYQPFDFEKSHDSCTIATSSGLWEERLCVSQYPYVCEKQKEMTTSSNLTNSAQTFTKFARACYYRHIRIICPLGSYINIDAAFWGRRNKHHCTYISMKHPCGVKDISTITQAIKNKCDYRGYCDLYASPTKPYLNDPCPTVNKYLEVNFTCVKVVDERKECKSGWKSFTHGCYRLFHEPKAWRDSRKICQNAGAELLSIEGDLEQQFATRLMERAWYENVWIGLNDLGRKGVYKWSDGSRVLWTNWYVGQPDERRTEKSCVFMSLMRGKRGWMYWRDQNCTDKYAFICKHRIGPTKKPATLPTVYPGNCGAFGEGWTTSDKSPYCYYPNLKNRLTWLLAEAFCKKKDDTSSIASLQSKEENEFVRKLTNITIWLGLEGRGVFRGYAWSDGDPVRYTNWEIGQPDSHNGRQTCVIMDPRTGRWSNIDCETSDTHGFVCKAKKRTDPTTSPVRTVYPTAGSPLCKKDWTLFQGKCYRTGNDTGNVIRFTWQEAEKHCQRFGAHLVSINSQSEQNFLDHLKRSRRYYGYHWIGLNDRASEGIYKWTDGSQFNYAHWHSHEPNDAHREEHCVEMNYLSGTWFDSRCDWRNSYICEAEIETYTPPIHPTLPTRPVTDGFCPKGWIAHARYCYEFHTDPSDYRTWDEARYACEKGRNSSVHGQLVSIHNKFEQAFITVHLQGAKQFLWIGMNSTHGSYHWIDKSVSNYFNWNRGEPFGNSDQCVEIVPHRGAAGRWNARDCSKLNGYICKKAAVDELRVTTTPTSKAEEANCPVRYRRYGKSCFKFVNSPQNFNNARKICGKENGDLMIVNNQYKQAFLVYLLERYIGRVWIGFVHEPYAGFKFVDHSSTIYTYWGPRQPNRHAAQRSCTQANLSGSNFGVWDDVDCSTTSPFICEIFEGKPRVTIPLNGSCPNGWRHYDKYCYKHFEKRLSWAKANHVCSRHRAHLVSISDDKEQKFVMHYYRHKTYGWIWTGLNNFVPELGFRWIDETPVTYINWKDGEPDGGQQYASCGRMYTGTGLWSDDYCSLSTYPYMCKRKIECSAVIPLDPTMVTATDTYNAQTHGADKAILKNELAHDTAWCSSNTSGSAKITIDLQNLYRVTGITLMGRATRNQHVKSFRIEHRLDGNWRPYYPYHSYHDIIEGIRSGDDISTLTFKHAFKADGLSITPITWAGNVICMKLRLYGCSYECQNELMLGSQGRAKFSITVSSGKRSTTNLKQTTVGHTWCAKTNDENQWIEVKFYKKTLITAISTFGDRKESYVKTYALQFSEDGKTWEAYKQHGAIRIFQGNKDATHVMKHSLISRTVASYVRILPITWNKNICMRFSLLGCETGFPTAQPTTIASSQQTAISTDKKTSSVGKGGNSDGLPDGAVAGVVITVIIVVAAVVALVIFYYRRRRRFNLFSSTYFVHLLSFSAKSSVASDTDDI